MTWKHTCPPKFCHKCYKLASRERTRLAINIWPPHKRTGNCATSSSFKEQQKPGRRKKQKTWCDNRTVLTDLIHVKNVKKPKDDPGPKEQAEMVEGMSGTLSFQPKPTTLSISEDVNNLKSYRGAEPLYPEEFVENIKHEYVCPICKEVLDQPVQTKSQTPHIFCAGCLSFAFEMCGSLCPVCRTVIENPKQFIQPAPFVLRTILSELDLQSPTCTHTVKLHQLPQHEANCTPNPMRAPTDNVTPIPGVVPGTPPSSVFETPVPTAAVRRKALVQTPPPQEQLEATGVATVSTATVYEEQLTVKQLLQSPKEVYSSLKEEVGLFIIRQFLSQSQDGETILLKTGCQVNNII